MRPAKTVSRSSETGTGDEEEVWNSLNSDALKTLPRKFQEISRAMQAERYHKPDQVLPVNNPAMTATPPEHLDLMENIANEVLYKIMH